MATPGFPRRGGRIDRHSLVSELGGNLLCVQPPSCPSPCWQAEVSRQADPHHPRLGADVPLAAPSAPPA